MTESRFGRVYVWLTGFAIGVWVVGFAIRAAIPPPPLDPKEWVGAEVMPKWRTEVVNDAGRVDSSDWPVPYTVRAVKGRRLDVGRVEPAWVRGSEVIKLDEALDYYSKLIGLGQETAWAFNLRGIVHHQRGEIDKAIADYDISLAAGIFRTTTNTYYNRGLAWRDKEDHEKALVDFNAALQRDPAFARAYVARGDLWAAKKDYVQALADLDRAVELAPKDALAYRTRAPVWDAKKDYARGLADYAAAVRFDPKYAPTLFRRSVLHMLAPRDDAVESFRALVDALGWNGPRTAYAVAMGHLAARRLKNEAAAAAFLADSAGKLPADWPAPTVEYLRGGLEPEALLAAARDEGERIEARCILGLDLALKGRPNDAKEHFRWVFEKSGPNRIERRIAVQELERLERPPAKGKR